MLDNKSVCGGSHAQLYSVVAAIAFARHLVNHRQQSFQQGVRNVQLNDD